MLHAKRHTSPTGTDDPFSGNAALFGAPCGGMLVRQARGTDVRRATWRVIARVDAPLLLSLVGWVGIGLVIGRLTYAALIRRPAKAQRADLPLTLILGLVGALIGGAVGWSTHGGLNAVLASLIGAALGTLLICLVFQFIVPV